MNTHINKNREQPKYDRKYLGVTITGENYKEILLSAGRDSINFHSKHLNAYLKGRDTFTHGWVVDLNGFPIRKQVHQVQQKLWNRVS